jgi:hypothetical protein
VVGFMLWHFLPGIHLVGVSFGPTAMVETANRKVRNFVGNQNAMLLLSILEKIIQIKLSYLKYIL